MIRKEELVGFLIALNTAFDCLEKPWRVTPEPHQTPVETSIEWELHCAMTHLFLALKMAHDAEKAGR